MTRLYIVDLDCPRCGKLHGVYGGPGCGLVYEVVRKRRMAGGPSS